MADPDELFTEAFSYLRQGLAKAFNQDPTLPRTVENERERIAAAVLFVGQFVATTIDRDIANRYFFELASALGNLNEGIVRPLLKRSPLHGRPPDPSNVWRARARVAVALYAFMRSGLSQGNAAGKIARDHPGLHRLAGKKAGNFATTIIDWRQEFGAKRVDDFEAAELFAEGIRSIGKLDAAGDLDDLKKLAADQLVKAATFVAELKEADPSSDV
jgi:hypothetical protein